MYTLFLFLTRNIQEKNSLVQSTFQQEEACINYGITRVLLLSEKWTSVFYPLFTVFNWLSKSLRKATTKEMAHFRVGHSLFELLFWPITTDANNPINQSFQNLNKCIKPAPSAGKRVGASLDWFWLFFWLVEKVTRDFLANRKVQYSNENH